MVMAPRIGIVSISGDLHPRAVARAIAKQRSDAVVHVFDVSSLPDRPGCVSVHQSQMHATLQDETGAHVELSTLDAVWWRRHSLAAAAKLPEHRLEAELVQRDTQAFIEGAFLSSFQGAWINHPASARHAENKLIQLATAARLGLRVADTIFTNDCSAVHRFQSANDQAVVKCISGVPGVSLTTQLLTTALASDKDAISASPACYQRLIGGNQHLRILLVGPYVQATLSLSYLVDSRIDEHIRYVPYQVPKEIVLQLRELLNCLGLAMGVVDMKIDDRGNFYFLELNQQGQILATDVQAGTSMCEVVSRYLLETATRNLTLRIWTPPQQQEPDRLGTLG